MSVNKKVGGPKTKLVPPLLLTEIPSLAREVHELTEVRVSRIGTGKVEPDPGRTDLFCVKAVDYSFEPLLLPPGVPYRPYGTGTFRKRGHKQPKGLTD